MLISMRIRMQGFVVFDFEKKYPEAKKQLAQWLSEGKLKRQETIVKGGVMKAEEALVGLFEGKNIGKCVFRSSLNTELMKIHRQDDGGGCEARGCQGEAIDEDDISLVGNTNLMLLYRYRLEQSHHARAKQLLLFVLCHVRCLLRTLSLLLADYTIHIGEVIEIVFRSPKTGRNLYIRT